jgi:membrane protein DedA with SNARE-associated domain
MGLADALNAVNEWALSLISALGYPGLAFVMFLENVFPPIPSEIVLPLAGSLTLTNRFSIIGVTLVGALGSIAGAFFFYGLGKWLGEERIRELIAAYGKWLMLSTEDFDKAIDWFDRYDEYVVFFSRMVPVVRSLISIPAGIASMNLVEFSAYTAVGTALWSFILALAGRLLGQSWPLVSEWIDRYETVVLILLAAVLVFFVANRLYSRIQKRDAI